MPAHNYVWSFEPRLDWSGVYATAQEIYKYLDDFKNKYGLDNYCKVNRKVVDARWDDSRGQWNVKVEDVSSGKIIDDTCDILINASSILNNWRYPAIHGLKDYKGRLLHSAAWDETVDLKGNSVGLIGIGYAISAELF